MIGLWPVAACLGFFKKQTKPQKNVAWTNMPVLEKPRRINTFVNVNRNVDRCRFKTRSLLRKNESRFLQALLFFAYGVYILLLKTLNLGKIYSCSTIKMITNNVTTKDNVEVLANYYVRVYITPFYQKKYHVCMFLTYTFLLFLINVGNFFLAHPIAYISINWKKFAPAETFPKHRKLNIITRWRPQSFVLLARAQLLFRYFFLPRSARVETIKLFNSWPPEKLYPLPPPPWKFLAN